MTRKERIISALEHRECDIIPFNADFTEQENEVMVAYTNDENFLNQLNCHLHYIQYWGWPTELDDKPEHFKDDFGVVWNRSGADKDIGVVVEPNVVDLEEYHYQFPVVDEARLRKEYEALIKTKDDKFTMAGFGFSMFERAWSLCGMENVLMGMVANEAELKQLFSDICDYNLHLIDIALEYDIDGVYFGDDWGQQSGLIMGAAHWRNFIKPNMKRMYDRVKSKGKFVMQHSCG
ncbi:MAG: uroporphyrinogen decarboxylase family protein, partial [Oscillospiraceae bacterium]